MEKFSYEENGYNRKEVNQFVDDVIKETEAIMVRVKGQQLQIEKLQDEINHYKAMEKNIKETIAKAEETGDSIKKLAYEESKMILQETKNNASKIINSALIQAEEIEKRKETLDKNMKIFKEKLKLIVSQQLSVVEQVDKLEIEEE